MLVLSRKMGDRILIGPNIEICVVRLDGNKVRLGITAPKEVGIIRDELLGRVEQAAAGGCLAQFRAELDQAENLARES